ncbi:MAG: hypothetical protein PHP46_02255, partial [Candidatus Omnitrophica bacterium]|nr:hypothetical protein [Candidatus Omnitrophota bacterium]
DYEIIAYMFYIVGTRVNPGGIQIPHVYCWSIVNPIRDLETKAVAVAGPVNSPKIPLNISILML